CQFCTLGKGCNIYSDRPRECKNFHCLWLRSEAMDDDLRPDKSYCVIYGIAKDNPANYRLVAMGVPPASIVVVVDPKMPDAWQYGKVWDMLQNWATDGEVVIVQIGKEQQLIFDHDRYPPKMP